MQHITHNGNQIQYYNSIDELPINRYQLHNKYTILDSGIGSTAQDVRNHYNRMYKLLQQNDIENLSKEIVNTQQNIEFIITGVNPALFSFIPLIHSINGKKLTDLSDENIKRTLDKLSKKGFTAGKLFGLLNQVKKNLMKNLTSFSQTSSRRRQTTITAS